MGTMCTFFDICDRQTDGRPTKDQKRDSVIDKVAYRATASNYKISKRYQKFPLTFNKGNSLEYLIVKI